MYTIYILNTTNRIIFLLLKAFIKQYFYYFNSETVAIIFCCFFDQKPTIFYVFFGKAIDIFVETPNLQHENISIFQPLLSLSLSFSILFSLFLSLYSILSLSLFLSLSLSLSPSLSFYLLLFPNISLSLFLSIYPSFYLSSYLACYLFLNIPLSTPCITVNSSKEIFNSTKCELNQYDSLEWPLFFFIKIILQNFMIFYSFFQENILQFFISKNKHKQDFMLLQNHNVHKMSIFW